VQSWGGKVTVESTPGKGSRFAFTLPYPAGETLVPRPRPTAPAPSAADGALPRRFDVVLVDDSDDGRMVVAAQLAALGVKVRAVADGEAAVRAVAAAVPDLVLMDVSMPGMDGIEATARMRRLGGEQAALPVVALTAFAGSDEVQRFIAEGLDGVLTKPISQPLLAAALVGWTAGLAEVEQVAAWDDAARRGFDRELGAERAQTLLASFRAETEQRRRALQLAAERRDLSGLAARAHSVRGSAGTYGAVRAERLAQALEEAALAGERVRALLICRRLVQHLDDLRTA
jgi:CheY-like chemotaxis protein